MNKSENLTIEEIFSLALQNQQKNNFKEALNFYNQVLEIDPNNLNARINLGAVFKGLGDNKKAKNCYEKVIEITPNYVNAHINLGNIFKDLKEYQKAKNCYEKAIEINPNETKAHNNLGNIFKELKKYEEAIDCFEKAIEIDPNFVNAYLNLGIVFQKLEEYQKAISCYEKAIEIDSNFVDPYINLGAILETLGEYKKAIDCYKKGVALKSDHEILLYNFGSALFATKQYKSAAEQFKLTNFKNSKGFLLSCLYKLDNKFNFIKELDDQIKQGQINAVIGSLTFRSEIKYGIKRLNPFCEDPFKYLLKTNLITQYDFKNIFVDPIKDFLKKNIFYYKMQGLLTNGQQTRGNLFIKKNYFLDQIKNIIHLEVDKYHHQFKKSKEGIVKSWPNSYSIKAWIVSMKSGGKLDPHMHEHGWLSGSIYINVPPKLEKDSGNLVLCVDDQESKVEENIKQKKIIDVETGSLCMFPASLYHYTIPFESKEDRIVLAFDVIPD